MRRRSNYNPLRRFLHGSQTPLALFSPEKKLVWCNPALTTWCGVSVDTLLSVSPQGGVTEQRSLAHAVIHSLSPPAETWEGRFQRRLLPVFTASGPRLTWVSWCPLQCEGTTRFYSLVLLETQSDITDRSDETAWDQPEIQRRILAQTRQELDQWLSVDLLVGNSPAIDRVRTQLELAERACARVVIVGSRGSGCQQLARHLYLRQTPSAAWPLIPLECRLLDAELLSTTVVSYVRSQWEWSDPERLVLLLLDVDALSPDAQWALWELLQRPKPRWHTLATAEKPLPELAESGQFREDLACYLSSLVIQLPHLRRREVDIPQLVRRVLETHASRWDHPVRDISPEALERLTHYPWPGEWEQFERVIMEAAQRCRSGVIELSDLPPVLAHAEQAQMAGSHRPEPIQIDRVLADFERQILCRALHLARGNRARAARLLGMSRARLLRRIQQLGIEGEPPHSNVPSSQTPESP